jgi:hypothetical protein
VRGAALSLLQRGADRVYLFNYMDSETTLDATDDYARLLREIGDPTVMAAQHRRHVLTFSDTSAVGEPQAAALPANLARGDWRAFRLHIGPCPRKGAARVVLAYESFDDLTPGTVDIYVNGEACGNAARVNPAKPSPEEIAWGYDVPLANLREGYNVVEIHANTALAVTWAELDVLP